MFEVKIDENTVFQVAENGAGLTLDGKSEPIEIHEAGTLCLQVLYGGKSFRVFVLNLNREEKSVLLRINGQKTRITLTTELDRLLKKMGFEHNSNPKARDLKAPMPGLIHSIEVAEGDFIAAGSPLLILEAMKMENVIKSVADVTIGKIHVSPKSTVEKGHLLITFL